jgi:hypothetical protein
MNPFLPYEDKKRLAERLYGEFRNSAYLCGKCAKQWIKQGRKRRR